MLTDAAARSRASSSSPTAPPPSSMPGAVLSAPSSPSLPLCHPLHGLLFSTRPSHAAQDLPSPFHSAAAGNAVTQGGRGLQGWGGQGQVFTDSGDCETREAPAVLRAQGSRAGRALEGLEMEGKVLGEARRRVGKGAQRL